MLGVCLEVREALALGMLGVCVIRRRRGPGLGHGRRVLRSQRGPGGTGLGHVRRVLRSQRGTGMLDGTLDVWVKCHVQIQFGSQ